MLSGWTVSFYDKFTRFSKLFLKWSLCSVQLNIRDFLYANMYCLCGLFCLSSRANIIPPCRHGKIMPRTLHMHMYTYNTSTLIGCFVCDGYEFS